MIDLAILGLLDEQDLHGYELRKRLGELLGMRLTVSFGSLYPALGRLERDAQVKAVSSKPAVTPTEPTSGSLAGELAAFRGAQRRSSEGTTSRRGTRGKKVYGITGSGRERLRELLTSPDVSDDRTFRLRVAFSPQLSSSERIQLFERRRAELVRRDDHNRAGADADTDGQLDNRYLRSLLERDTQAIAVDLAWLDRLIAAEQAAGDNEDGDDTDGGNP